MLKIIFIAACLYVGIPLIHYLYTEKDKDHNNKVYGGEEFFASHFSSEPTEEPDYLFTMMARLKFAMKKLKVYRANITHCPYVSYQQIVLNVDKSNFDEELYYFDSVGGLVGDHNISIQEIIRDKELSIKIYDKKSDAVIYELLYQPEMYMTALGSDFKYACYYASSILSTFQESEARFSENWYTKTGEIIKN